MYGGVRIGCYAPLKTVFAGRRANAAEKGKTSLVEMIAAGASAGAIATIVRDICSIPMRVDAHVCHQ